MDMTVETFRARHVARSKLMVEKVRLLTDLRSLDVGIIGSHAARDADRTYPGSPNIPVTASQARTMLTHMHILAYFGVSLISILISIISINPFSIFYI